MNNLIIKNIKKVALCISGYFIGKCDSSYSNYIYDNIIIPLEFHGYIVDIFIFSFDINNKNIIIAKYPNYKICIIEEQYDFIKNLNESNIEYYTNVIVEYDLQTNLSQIYSKSKCIENALKYMKDNNFTYDFIIRCRFDIGIRLNKPFDGYKPDELTFKTIINYLDFNYFYSSYWNQLNAGYADLWEFSNAYNMETFSMFYKYLINNMLILNSEYLKLLNRWPDSSKDNYNSNLMLNKNYYFYEPECYNIKNSTNPHLQQKFYMIKCGLYKISKFLDFTPNSQKIIYD